MSMVSGIQGQILDVTVVGCSKLKDTEWISRQDPYVCLEYATTKFRTRTCTDGGKHPIFQEKTVIPLIEGLREITVTVWNSNTLTFDDFIGTSRVQLQKVLSQGYDDSSWPLQSKSGKFAGEVKLILHFANAQKPQIWAASYASAPQMYMSSAAPYGLPAAYGPSKSVAAPPSLYPPPIEAYPPAAYAPSKSVAAPPSLYPPPIEAYPPADYAPSKSVAAPPSSYPLPTDAYPPAASISHPGAPTAAYSPPDPAAAYPAETVYAPPMMQYPPPQQMYPPPAYPPQPYPPAPQTQPYYPAGPYPGVYPPPPY